MKCPKCKAEGKYIRVYNTVNYDNLIERRRLCTQCGERFLTNEIIAIDNSKDLVAEELSPDEKRKMHGTQDYKKHLSNSFYREKILSETDKERIKKNISKVLSRP